MEPAETKFSRTDGSTNGNTEWLICETKSYSNLTHFTGPVLHEGSVVVVLFNKITYFKENWKVAFLSTGCKQLHQCQQYLSCFKAILNQRHRGTE